MKQFLYFVLNLFSFLMTKVSNWKIVHFKAFDQRVSIVYECKLLSKTLFHKEIVISSIKKSCFVAEIEPIDLNNSNALDLRFSTRLKTSNLTSESDSL